MGAPWDRGTGTATTTGSSTRRRMTRPTELYALWDGAVARSRTRLDSALSDGGLDELVHASVPDGRHASLRRLLCDLIEEYGRHTGHADLLREAVDGRDRRGPALRLAPPVGSPGHLTGSVRELFQQFRQLRSHVHWSGEVPEVMPGDLDNRPVALAGERQLGGVRRPEGEVGAGSAAPPR